MTRLLLMSLTIFLAELGDKTQIATMLFASDRENSAWGVFAASAFALVLGSALSVALGTFARSWLDTIPLKLIAGVIFIVIGLWSIFENYRGA
jgi:putative Ca2+/H+ antiporter (TMEM165/GDT1 family)